MGPRDRHRMGRAARASAPARARDGVCAALYLPAGMPDRLDGLSVEVGPANQPGLPGAEKLDVRPDARRVAPVRSVPQARTLRWRRPRPRKRDGGAGPQGMAVGGSLPPGLRLDKHVAGRIPAGAIPPDSSL